MLSTLQTIIFEHDLRLVALAAAVCATAAFSAIILLTHARKNTGNMQKIWLAIAAIACGFGIWATHFIGMLAFNPGMALGYDIGLTGLSLFIAMTITGGGFWIAAIGRRKSDLYLGGIVTGIAIAAMHYTGMASVLVGGEVTYDPTGLLVSVFLGGFLGALGFALGMRDDTMKWKITGAITLTIAICAMHFTGMGAASFADCFAIVGPNDGVAHELMPLAIATGSILILLAALGGVYMELRDRRHAERESDRMRGLANAAVEGLIVCDGETIVTVNNSFAKLVERAPETLTGHNITDYIPANIFKVLREHPEIAVETELQIGGSVTVAAEIILRTVDYGGKPQHAIAVRDLSARKEAEQYIRFLAHHDALTGLPNRASFSERLEREIKSAQKHGTRFAVLCLDLDRFKEVNDLFGHATGDAVLKRVGQCLSQTFHEGQMAARLGGDEFAMLLPEIHSPDDAGRVAGEILQTFVDDNNAAHSGALLAGSIGIAIFPDNADDATHLMNHADTALYRAKEDGRGTFCYFQDQMGIEVRDRRLLEHELRHAIVRQQLELVYQPQVRIKDNELTGFEALLRWHHPERGDISPAVFIPLAEESGLILQIGEWALETACREAAGWKNPLSIAVNVSTVQLHSKGFPQKVQDVLRKTGLSPRRLELEITETALIKDMARALATLGQLKALGVRIAMDDFGTGYSSLSNLRAFAFDKIKVDQSFIRSVDRSDQSATIVRAVLGLGHGLNLPVLAEGVERLEELDFLKGETCAEAQGFFLGRPVTIDHFTEYTLGDKRILEAPSTTAEKPMRVA